MGTIRKIISVAVVVPLCTIVGTMIRVKSVFAQPNSVISDGDRYQAAAQNEDLRAAVISMINYFLGFLGLIAVIVIIISGVKLVASQGNDTAVKSAQKTIGYAALGLLLVFFAYAIVTFIVNIAA